MKNLFKKLYLSSLLKKTQKRRPVKRNKSSKKKPTIGGIGLKNRKQTPYYPHSRHSKHQSTDLTIHSTPKTSEYDWKKFVWNDDNINKLQQILESHLSRDKHNNVIYGKFWMEGCFHCIGMAEEWKKLKEYMKTDSNHSHYINVDIEASNVEKHGKPLLQNVSGVANITVDGYPTIYKIKDGKIYTFGDDVDTRNKSRTEKEMKEWLLKDV